MKQKLCPWLTAAAGLLCALLWQAVWAGIYDPETQLVSDDGSAGLFGLLLLVLAALLLVLARPWTRQTPPSPALELPARALRCGGGLAALIAGVWMIAGQLAAPALIPLLLGALLAASGVVMVWLALGQGEPGLRQGLVLLPTFTACYWLVAFYHEYGSDPSWVTYLWPMLAGLAAVWCWIALSGDLIQPDRSHQSLPWAVVTVLLICPALTSPLSTPYRLSLLAQLLWLWPSVLAPAVTRKENPHV